MFSLLIDCVVALLKVLLPMWFNRKPDTCEDARRQPELKARLQDRLRKSGWTVGLVLLVLVPVGCMRTRTVYIPPGEPVRLRESLPDVKIWTKDQDGNNISGTVDIPEGYYVLPDEEG